MLSANALHEVASTNSYSLCEGGEVHYGQTVIDVDGVVRRGGELTVKEHRAVGTTINPKP